MDFKKEWDKANKLSDLIAREKALAKIVKEAIEWDNVKELEAASGHPLSKFELGYVQKYFPNDWKTFTKETSDGTGVQAAKVLVDSQGNPSFNYNKKTASQIAQEAKGRQAATNKDLSQIKAESDARDTIIQPAQERVSSAVRDINDHPELKTLDGIKAYYTSRDGEFSKALDYLTQFYKGDIGKVYQYISENKDTFNGTKAQDWLKDNTNEDGTFKAPPGYVSTEDVETAQKGADELAEENALSRAENGTAGFEGLTPEEQVAKIDEIYNKEIEESKAEIDPLKEVQGDLPDLSKPNETEEAPTETPEANQTQNNKQISPEQAKQLYQNSPAQNGVSGKGIVNTQGQTQNGVKGNSSKEFWDDWKSGKFDMYPTMKAVADSIAKKAGKFDMYPTMKAVADSIAQNARMTMDRAALLTGGQRDYDAYNPIETEQDRIRAKQIETRALDANNKTVGEYIKDYQNAQTDEERQAALKGLSSFAAQQGMDADKFIQSLNLQDASKVDKYAKQEDEKKDLDMEKTRAEVKKVVFEQQEDIRASIQTIDQNIQNAKAKLSELAGPAWDAYQNVLEQQLSSLRGVVASQTSSITSKNWNVSGDAGTDGLVKAIGLDIGAEGGIEGGKSNNDAVTRDELVAKQLDTAMKNALASMQDVDKSRAGEIENYTRYIAEQEAQKQYLQTLLTQNN